VEGAQPFFIRCTKSHKRLVDLIECFLTPAHDFIRSRLTAFRIGPDMNLIALNPFTSDPKMIPSGARVAFSFQSTLDSEGSGLNYARAFLDADRTPLIARWQVLMHQPARLPAIYDPATPITISRNPGTEITQVLYCMDASSAFLLAITHKDIYAVDLDRWGESDAVSQNPFQRVFSDISCVSSGLSSDQIYVAGDGLLFRGITDNWRLDPKLDIPGQEHAKSPLKHYVSWDAHNALCLFENLQLWYASPFGLSKINLVHNSVELHPAHMYCLPNGDFVFTDVVQKSVWHVRLKDMKPCRIFGPVPVGPLRFCVDKQNILYILDGAAASLHILLPHDHWICHVCGAHQPHFPSTGVCPACGAILQQTLTSRGNYTHWLDIDLSSIAKPLSAIAVDNDLNVYVVGNGSQLTALPMSRRDMWGERKD